MTNHEGKTRATRRYALVTALAIAGCAAEQGTGDEEVIERLEELGYDRDEISVNGDAIVVDGDMIMFRDQLLADAYQPQAITVESGGPIEKGYRYVNKVSSTHIGTAKLIWATGSWAPDTAMKNAFINAAGDYNSVPNCPLVLSQNNPGPATIKVHSVPETSWPPVAGCATDATGCAEIPANGRPGANIYMRRTGVNSDCFNWTESSRNNRARHELGHAYGFAHPKEAGATRIPNTAGCGGSCGPNTPTYSTVMKEYVTLVVGPCTTNVSVLQTDDRLSADLLY